MTVAELIAALQECPPDVDVLLAPHDGPWNDTLTDVTYQSPNPDIGEFDGVVILA